MKRYLKRTIIFIAGSLFFSLLLLFIGLQMPMPALPSAPKNLDLLIISDVTVIDPSQATRSEAQTVVVAEGRILYIGPEKDAPNLSKGTRLSGTGKYLIPSLWDMHVHTISLSPQLHFPLLIANGVTNIRDMGDGCSWSTSLECHSYTKQWREAIDLSQLIGPRIHQAAHYHIEDLGEEKSPEEQIIKAKDLVAALKLRGDETLKLQLPTNSDPALFQAILIAAREADMPVSGHLPYNVDLLDPVNQSMRSIEHDSSLLPQCSDNFAQFDGRNRSKQALLSQRNARRCDEILSLMATKAIAFVPTHIASNGQDWMMLQPSLDQESNRNYIVAPQRWLWQLVSSLSRAGVKKEHHSTLRDFYHASLQLSLNARQKGVRVLAGTDSLDTGVIHGFSLHQELQELVKAGFTPAQALASATSEPAQFMGKERELGKIAAGYKADMILLNRDPLIDISNTQSIDSLIYQGRLYRNSDLQQLRDAAQQQASSFATASQFVWRLIRP